MMNNYDNMCAIVICHGKTECEFVSNISSILNVNVKPWGREKGKKSIQLNGLSKILSNSIFKNTGSLIKKYPAINYTGKGKKLLDFKLFTMMDLDDCSDKSVVNNYKNGHVSGIGKNSLGNYIDPIYCDQNFEDMLLDINFKFVAKSKKDKSKYIKVFDPVKGMLSDEKSIEEMYKKCQASDLTNMDRFLKYCLDHKKIFN